MPALTRKNARLRCSNALKVRPPSAMAPGADALQPSLKNMSAEARLDAQGCDKRAERIICRLRMVRVAGASSLLGQRMLHRPLAANFTHSIAPLNKGRRKRALQSMRPSADGLTRRRYSAYHTRVHRHTAILAAHAGRRA